MHVKQCDGDEAIDVDGQAPSPSEKLASASHFGQEVLFVRPHRSKRVLGHVLGRSVAQAQRKTNVVID